MQCSCSRLAVQCDRSSQLLSKRMTRLSLRMQSLGASLGDNPALRRSRELREDLRDRWETSDSSLVHRIQVLRRPSL